VTESSIVITSFLIVQSCNIEYDDANLIACADEIFSDNQQNIDNLAQQFDLLTELPWRNPTSPLKEPIKHCQFRITNCAPYLSN
jgi:hypothetical protein